MFERMIVSPDDGSPMEIPGSIRIMASCGHWAVVSPDGRAFLASRPGILTACSPCVGPDYRRRIKRAVPGALAAIEKADGPEKAAKVRRVMKLYGIEDNG